METLELLKECQTKVEVPQEENSDHKLRVAKFLNLPEKENGDTELNNTIKQLKESNFKVFVKREEVFTKFKYHAGISGSYEESGEENFTFRDSLSVILWFAQFGFYIWFTVSHIWVGAWSFLLVIPVTIICAFIMGNGKFVNYVGDVPEFILDNVEKIKSIVPKPRLTIHSCQPMPVEYQKVDPVMICWLNDEIGVVVGVWDRDKEIEVLS